MVFFENRAALKNASLITGVVLFFGAFLIYAGSGYFARMEEARNRATAGYVHGVFRESRTGLAAAEEKRLAEVIIEESGAYRLDPVFVLALMKTESEFYNWSRSGKGALGLMQILPSTGRELAAQLKFDWKGEQTLFDPYLNVKMGIHYYTGLKERYNNDTRMTLAAYNAGPGRVNYRIRMGTDVGRAYAARVLENYEDLKERAGYYAHDGQ